MSLNEDVYANAEEFNPLRYLSRPEGNAEPFLNASFGFGRRSEAIRDETLFRE
jgi:cytochrome P450